jgi:hypothetical protein
MRDFGELMLVSHDGDRVARRTSEGDCRPWRIEYDDAYLERTLEDLSSGDPGRAQRAGLAFQPGGYDCSVPELDCLVDIAKNVPGVLGASLTGGGLGGNILVLVERDRTAQLIDVLLRNYYLPRDLPPTAVMECRSVAGTSLWDC